MVNNVFTEDTVSEIAVERIPARYFPDYEHFHTHCVIDGQLYTLENVSSVPKENWNLNFTSILVGNEEVTVSNQCVYGVDGIYAMSVGDFLIETLIGSCGAPSPASASFEDTIWLDSTTEWYTVPCQPWYIKNLINKGNASFESIDANMQAIATSITSEMRKQGTDWDYRRGD
jgi:hypothetical protein